MTQATGVEALPTADFFDYESLLSVPEQRKLQRAAGVPGHGDRTLRGGVVEQGRVPRAHPAEARRAGAEHAGPARLQPPVRRTGDRRNDPRGHLDRHLFPGPPRSLRRVALRVRLGGPAEPPARRRLQPAHHGRLRPDRTRARLRRRRRHGDPGPPDIGPQRSSRRRRRLLGAERRQTLDRQRDVLRLHAGVGAGRGRRRRPRLHRGCLPAGSDPQPDRKQDCAADRAERRHCVR